MSCRRLRGPQTETVAVALKQRQTSSQLEFRRTGSFATVAAASLQRRETESSHIPFSLLHRPRRSVGCEWQLDLPSFCGWRHSFRRSRLALTELLLDAAPRRLEVWRYY